jgi:hypothetical protein
MWDKKKLLYEVTVYDTYKNYSTNMLSAECLNITCGNYSCKIRHSRARRQGGCKIGNKMNILNEKM